MESNTGDGNPTVNRNRRSDEIPNAEADYFRQLSAYSEDISLSSHEATCSMVYDNYQKASIDPSIQELDVMDLYPKVPPRRLMVERPKPLEENRAKESPMGLMDRIKAKFGVLRNRISPSQHATQQDPKTAFEEVSDFDLEEHQKTLDHPPNMDFYHVDTDRKPSTMERSSLSDLVHGKVYSKDIESIEFGETKDDKPKEVKKLLSWPEGVFVRCVSNIFGVMLYLRISWMAGQAGLFYGSLIILLSSAITLITALSTSAICTNGIVGGGGVYFLISRSLGPEFGGSIGIIFSIANGFGAAMHIVGLAETIRDALKEYGVYIIDAGINDVRIIGLAWCTILIIIVFAGTAFESKTQLLFVGIIIFSIIDYYIGSFLPISHKQAVRGMTGISLPTLNQNFLPSFRDGYTFVAVFAVFFPAATGIMAGANISGDLKDPGRAIPLGTVLAIAVTSTVYMTFLWISGASFVRDADGMHVSVFEYHEQSDSTYFVRPDCFYNNSCEYGLMNNFQIIEQSSLWGPLIIAGIFASTLSSALTCLVSAPKLFQAVCKDKIFPYIDYFGKGYGPNEEPRKAYVLTYLLACGIICIGELNAIAPYITNFYLCSYALINYACFDCSFSRSPGFRPSFKYYNMWISLLGAILCVSSMFIISWFTSLITFIFFLLLFFYLRRTKPGVNWGSTDQAHTYRNALSNLIRLDKIEEHVKTYRPQILVLTGNPAARPSLVDFAYNITKGNSLMICGNVVNLTISDSVMAIIKNLNEKIHDWLKARHIKAFNISVANKNLQEGVRSLLQITGLGRLKPNVLLMGFKQDWAVMKEEKYDELNEYFGIITDAFENNMAVGILRNGSNGFDLTELMLNLKSSNKDLASETKKHFAKSKSTSKIVSQIFTRSLTISPAKSIQEESRHHSEGGDKKAEDLMVDDHQLVTRVNQFNIVAKKGVIDVWWLYDDGGLTLLVPYLLTRPRSFLENAKLRVFTLASKHSKIDEEQKNMMTLLKKFRITFADVIVLPNSRNKPTDDLLEEFEKTIKPFRVQTAKDKTDKSQITDVELMTQQDRTYRFLRIAENLRKYSKESNLVVVTLPVPRKSQTSSVLYMAWIDMMTRELPPTLMIRGNQTQVLTFYS